MADAPRPQRRASAMLTEPLGQEQSSAPLPPPRTPPRRFPIKRTIALLVLLTVLFGPHLSWRLTTPRAVTVVLVDKTLPHPRWREHERLHWWLDHRRVLDPRGTVAWDETRDYVGYDPVARRGHDLTDSTLAAADLVYIADAYGVYQGDYGSDSTTGLEPSARIYGGVTLDETAALERYVARGGSLVAEFNTLEEPTSTTEASARVGALLGVRFERWLGRWYSDLSSAEEIPRWMRERYERIYWKPWGFRGPGIVVISETSDRLVVIDSSEFAGAWPITVEVDDTGDPLTARVRTGQPYWYWFSGVSPTDSGSVLASYRLHVTPAASQRLAMFGFPTRFPAVVRHRGSGVRAYFAGDFADVGVEPPPLRRTRFLDWFGRWTARETKPGSQRRFFWRVTIPLWDAMLSEAGHAADASPTPRD